MTLSATLLLSLLALAPSEPGLPRPGADTARAATSTASLTIRSDVDSAVVLLDAHPAGKTPLVIDTLAAGTHTVRVIDPDVTNWLATVESDTITLNPGEARVLHYSLRSMISIDTRPSGARVLAGDSLIGVTPFLLKRDVVAPGAPLAVVKGGFEGALIRPEEAYRGALRIDLRPVWNANPQGASAMAPAISPASNALKISIACGATVLAGIAAASMRIQADDMEARYLATGDPRYLGQRDHYDLQGAVALVLTEIGVGFICYLLLSE
jgi:hypothetical protein